VESHCKKKSQKHVDYSRVPRLWCDAVDLTAEDLHLTVTQQSGVGNTVHIPPPYTTRVPVNLPIYQLSPTITYFLLPAFSIVIARRHLTKLTMPYSLKGRNVLVTGGSRYEMVWVDGSWIIVTETHKRSRSLDL
jgi:hypothetical protein